MATIPTNWAIVTVYFVLLLHWPIVANTNQLAFVSNANYSSDIRAFENGDVVLGGLFSVHFEYNPLTRKCTYISERGVKWVQAMIYTVDQINEIDKLLPNITIGFDIRDTCSSANHALEESLDFVIYSHLQDDRRRQTLFGNACPDLKTNNNYNNSDQQDSSSAIPNIAVVIGGRSSRVSISVASLLSNFDIAQISYASTSRILSDTVQYRSFFRTVPTDENQSKVMVDIVKHFQWTYVATVAVDDSYGRLGISTFKEKAATEGICIAIDRRFPSQNNHEAIKNIVSELKLVESAKVIIMFCAEYEAIDFLEEAQKQNLTGRIFIGSDAWGDSPKVAKLRPDIVRGMLGVVLNGNVIPPFERYLHTLDLCNNHRNPWFKQLWYAKSQKHDLPFDENDCNIDSRLTNNYTDTFYKENSKVAYVMDAIFAAAHALHNMLNCTLTHCTPFDHKRIDRGQFLKYIQNVSFNAISVKNFHFSPEGDALGVYEIKNLQPSRSDPQTLQFITVGTWDMSQPTGLELQLNDDKISWYDNIPASKCSDDCQPGTYRKFSTVIACCWECIQCTPNRYSNDTNEAHCDACALDETPNLNASGCIPKAAVVIEWNSLLSVSILTMIGITYVLIISTWIILMKYRKSPIVKASNILLSHFLLVGVWACSTAPLLFISRATPFTCNVTLFLFNISIALVMSTILAKTNRISQIFQNALSRDGYHSSIKRNSTQAAFICTLTGLEIVICVIATVTDPIKVTRQHGPNSKDIYLRCESDTKIGYSIAVIYLGMINLVCVYLAFKTRKLPENFNEAKYVSFTSLIMFCITFTMIPAYFGTSGPFQAAVASFGIIAFAVAVLLCMFLPRIYVVIFKPELNTKERAMLDLASYTFSNANFISTTGSRRSSLGRPSVSCTLGSIHGDNGLDDSTPVYLGRNRVKLSLTEGHVYNTRSLSLTPDASVTPSPELKDTPDLIISSTPPDPSRSPSLDLKDVPSIQINDNQSNNLETSDDSD